MFISLFGKEHQIKKDKKGGGEQLKTIKTTKI